MGDDESLLGRVLGGRYKIEVLVGRGGFGAVYRATHLELLRPVAIKTLVTVTGQSAGLVARFRREARLQATLRHPAIVRLLDFGREPDGLVYMVQEYVEGRTLHAFLSHRGRLDVEEASHLLTRLLDGLAAAHREGIIHRDLKPANIMLVDDHTGLGVRILDFGLAKVRDSMDESQTITQTGQILGTPAFMAPEQIEQRMISPATDIYAVGAMLYLMLVGQRPFAGSLRAVLTAHLVKPPPALPGDMPPRVDALIQRAMAKEPAQRYATAEEMLAALRSASAPSPADPAMPEPTLRSIPPAIGQTHGIAAHSLPGDGPGGPDSTIRTPSLSTSWRGAIEGVDPEEADSAPARAGSHTRRAALGLLLVALIGALVAGVVGLRAAGDGERTRSALAVDTTPPAEGSDPASALEPTDALPADATRSTDAGVVGPDTSAVDAAIVAAGIDAELPDAEATVSPPDADAPARAQRRRTAAEPRGPGSGTPSGRRSGPRSPPPIPPRPDEVGTDDEAIARATARPSIKLLAIEQSFERALLECRCEEASRLIGRAELADPRARLDQWRSRHLRTCVLKATAHCN